MVNRILFLTKRLIEQPSTKENPEALRKVLAVAEKKLGDFTIERFDKESMPSNLVYAAKERPKRFKVILNAHLDVVPAKEEQYHPYEKDGKLYGRGSNDMKAAAAAEILVFSELANTLPYPLGLQLVTDEEIGGYNGVKYQLDQGVRADFIIAGEPTDFGINNKAKGIIWAKVKTKGASAHGAYPWQGNNALWKLHEILERIKQRFPVPKKEVWNSTINLARIESSNQTFSKVPDDATAFLDVRFIPEDESAMEDELNKLLQPHGEIEILENEPCQFTDEQNLYIQKLQTASEKVIGKQSSVIVKHGGSDIRHYNTVGCDGVTFGPVGAGLHTDNEWVDIKSLEQYYNTLKEFLLSLA